MERITSDHQNNIMVESTNSDIILDCQIKTHDGWAARVKFLYETSNERVQSATASWTKNINDLHCDLGHPSEYFTNATTKAMGLQTTVTSSHVKIAPWERSNRKKSAKRLLHGQNFWEKGFSFI